MFNYFIIGLGGFLGTIFRFALNNVIYANLSYPFFPYGTFIVNVLGCLFIGLIAGLSDHRLTISPELRMFIQIGILGGFTTFSTFGYETFNLLRDGQIIMAVINVLGQVILGLFAVWLGYVLVK